MTTVSTELGERDTRALRGTFSGDVIFPQDAGYEEARRVWNGSIDKRPAAVLRPADESAVAAALAFARSRGLVVSVRGGGHNVAGFGTCDGGIVIDLSRMRDVEVDPSARRASVGGGALWSDVDTVTQQHGLAVTGGLISSTGVGGFTLGGGIGWMQRKHGLACDSLVSVTLVTAAGDVVDVSADSDPELFWALRGGGGNFGIATRFEFDLHPLGPEVAAGLVFYTRDGYHEVVRGFREFASGAPDEAMAACVSRLAPPAPFLPEEHHGKPVVAVAGCYSGPAEEGMEVLRPLKELGAPIGDVLMPRPYLQLQSMLDPSWGPGFGNYWKAEYLRGLPDEAIDVLASALDAITSPLSDFKIPMLGGAVARVGEDDTAYGHRGAPFVLNINARWGPGAAEEPHVKWTRSLWDSMQPFSDGGSYVNFMGEEGSDRVRAAYGDDKYDRLVAVKDRLDPDNVFRLNQNIVPSSSP
jgi:FAD/FMN-containing dehydrogenase